MKRNAATAGARVDRIISALRPLGYGDRCRMIAAVMAILDIKPVQFNEWAFGITIKELTQK